jgi:basic membrane protein A
MKKLSIVLAALMLVAMVLTACAPKAPVATEAPKATEKPAEPAKPKIKVCQVTDTGGIDDKSFNAMAWDGVEKAIAELGVEGKYIESQQASDYEVNLNACKDEGADLIIGVGALMWDATQNAALANPKGNYAGVDIESFSWTTMGPVPNFWGNVTEINDSTFLAGYL